MLAAKLLAQISKRHGWSNFTYFEYPSLIKGGHQSGQVFAHPEQATSQKKLVDVLLVLNPDGLSLHIDELFSDTLVLYESNLGDLDISQYQTKTSHIVSVPIAAITKAVTEESMAVNMTCLGISCFTCGLDTEIAKQTIIDDLAGKPEKIIQADLKAFEAGFNYAQANLQPVHPIISPQPDTQIMLTGNEAIGLGAISAGIQFYSAYPMTPSSGLLHYLAEQQFNYPLVVKHAEDEIGAINHALGASYAGVRAMTGTSGGGLALMTETVALASITETPLVILDAQRAGPATGLPTWTAQADLSFVLTMGHGDIQRAVLTPGTIEEHYSLTRLAFDLADTFQIPVFILSDKHALESYATMAQPPATTTINREGLATDTQLPTDNSYLRYQITYSGVSPRTIPGQAHGLHLANSYEHDEWGFATEDAIVTKNQVEKRARKMETITQLLPQPVLFGPPQAEMTLVSWGSTVLATQELVFQAMQQSLSINAIHLPCVWPFPSNSFSELAKNAKQLVMIEANQSGQAERLVRQETGIQFDHHIRRYDGRPFYVEELLVELKGWL